jgi:hypothetical protein
LSQVISKMFGGAAAINGVDASASSSIAEANRMHRAIEQDLLQSVF